MFTGVHLLTEGTICASHSPPSVLKVGETPFTSSLSEFDAGIVTPHLHSSSNSIHRSAVTT